MSKAYTICVKLDSGAPCYGQLTAVRKGIRCRGSPDCIAGSSVKLIDAACFLKLFTDELVLIDDRLRTIMKRSYK